MHKWRSTGSIVRIGVWAFNYGQKRTVRPAKRVRLHFVFSFWGFCYFCCFLRYERVQSGKPLKLCSNSPLPIRRALTAIGAPLETAKHASSWRSLVTDAILSGLECERACSYPAATGARFHIPRPIGLRVHTRSPSETFVQ